MIRDVHRVRTLVNSVKFAKDTVRAALQSEKAKRREYKAGDWVLRQREQQHKFEPFYEGPLLVRKVHRGNRYTLSTPNGVEIKTPQHFDRLKPAYVWDYDPVPSLWYANKRLYAQDRARIEARAKGL